MRARNERAYPDVYTQPSAEARKFARWGLDARRQAPKSRKGGLTTQEAGEEGVGSGVARARDIAAGKRVNAAQVAAFFARHAGYYEAAMERFRSQDLPLREYATREKAIQNWWLWGGDPLRDQAEQAMEAHLQGASANPSGTHDLRALKRRLMR